MSAQEDVFKGDLSDINQIDVDSPLGAAKKSCCEYYGSAYRSAADAAEKAGQQQPASVYRFLEHLTGCHLRTDTPERPFVAFFAMENGRTFDPSDLSQRDIAAINALIPRTSAPSLQARLNDLLWEVAKDYQALVRAAESYCTSATNLYNNSSWVYGEREFHRALQLSSKLGLDKPAFQACVAAIDASIEATRDREQVFAPIKLLEMLLPYRQGDPARYAAICAELGRRQVEMREHYKARYCFEIEAKYHRLAKNESAELSAKEKIGESFVSEGEQRASGEKPSFLAATTFLINGIEALRQARVPRERVEVLRKQLAEYQEKSLSEMGEVSASVDITEAVAQAREHVKAETFNESLAKLALGSTLVPPARAREEALKLAARFPISHLFGRATVDDKGRPIARRNGLSASGKDDQDAEVQAVMFENAARFRWGIRAEAFINPARLQVLYDHHPTFADFVPLIQYNPFVPPGHENLFIRGLHAGMHGDLMVACHLLVPQVENSLRCLLESYGVDISNLMSDGTQPVKILGALLSLPKTTEILGEDVVFELRGHLNEKSGFDFRNRLAHGFASDDECNSIPALSVWWLVLRICLMARIGKFKTEAANEDGQPNDHPMP